MQDSQRPLEETLYRYERVLTDTISDLQQRKTKTVGKSYAERIAFHLFRLSMLIKRGVAPGDVRLFRLRRLGRDLTARTPRERGIDILKAVLDLVASIRASVSETRVEELEGQVKDLQAQLARSRAISEAEEEEEAIEKVSVDVSQADSVFVIMPFDPAFDDVWKGGIERAAREEGFVPIRTDMISRSTDITDLIVESLAKCHIAIVDVTGNNPNVMFELGYALAKGKERIIITQSPEVLPFDIRQIQAIKYANTWSGIEELRDRVQEFLRNSKKSQRPKARKKKTKPKKRGKRAKRSPGKAG